MTNYISTRCDGCGKEEEGEDQFEAYYKRLFNAGPAVDKVHYCDDCEPEEDLLEEHPLANQ